MWTTHCGPLTLSQSQYLFKQITDLLQTDPTLNPAVANALRTLSPAMANTLRTIALPEQSQHLFRHITGLLQTNPTSIPVAAEETSPQIVPLPPVSIRADLPPLSAYSAYGPTRRVRGRVRHNIKKVKVLPINHSAPYKCPYAECSKSSSTTCKCKLSDKVCADGHKWHRHGDKVYLTASPHAMKDDDSKKLPHCPVCVGDNESGEEDL
jgi:hypothetical protein